MARRNVDDDLEIEATYQYIEEAPNWQGEGVTVGGTTEDDFGKERTISLPTWLNVEEISPRHDELQVDDVLRTIEKIVKYRETHPQKLKEEFLTGKEQESFTAKQLDILKHGLLWDGVSLSKIADETESDQRYVSRLIEDYLPGWKNEHMEERESNSEPEKGDESTEQERVYPDDFTNTQVFWIEEIAENYPMDAAEKQEHGERTDSHPTNYNYMLQNFKDYIESRRDELGIEPVEIEYPYDKDIGSKTASPNESPATEVDEQSVTLKEQVISYAKDRPSAKYFEIADVHDRTVDEIRSILIEYEDGLVYDRLDEEKQILIDTLAERDGDTTGIMQELEDRGADSITQQHLASVSGNSKYNELISERRKELPKKGENELENKAKVEKASGSVEHDTIEEKLEPGKMESADKTNSPDSKLDGWVIDVALIIQLAYNLYRRYKD